MGLYGPVNLFGHDSFEGEEKAVGIQVTVSLDRKPPISATSDRADT
jgi:hypothetical protein